MESLLPFKYQTISEGETLEMEFGEPVNSTIFFHVLKVGAGAVPDAALASHLACLVSHAVFVTDWCVLCCLLLTV